MNRTTLVYTLTSLCLFAEASFCSELVAVNTALEIVKQAQEPTYKRYVWVQNPSDTATALVSITANAVISQNEINFGPYDTFSAIRVYGNLIELDLFLLGNGEADKIEKLVKAWDKFFDPRFYVEVLTTSEVVVDSEPYTHEGKTYTKKRRVVETRNSSFGDHVETIQAESLRVFTKSEKPIVSYEWFLYGAWSADPVRGLYYDLTLLKGLTRKTWLESLGLKEGNFPEQRVYTIQSEVTGKGRVTLLSTRPAKPGRSQGLIAITQDPFDESVLTDQRFDPILDLINFKHNGEEIIFEAQNGHHRYILFDADGNLIDFAPDALVADHQIPVPFTKRLGGGISCVRCHEEGWKPIQNDFRELLTLGIVVQEAELASKIYGLYGDDISTAFDRGNQDLSQAIWKSSGPVTDANGLPWKFKDFSRELRGHFNELIYAPVTPEIALAELGASSFEKDLPISTNSDIRLAILAKGKKILRYQWNFVYIMAASEVRNNEKNSSDSDSSDK